MGCIETVVIISIMVAGMTLIWDTLSKHSKIYGKRHPPVVNLTDEEMFNNPLESYERALKMHGPIIAVKRKGRMEIIVSEEFTKQVLTEDTTFSFESGVSKILNIQFMYKMFGGTFFRDIDSVIHELVSKRLDKIIMQIYPTFQANADILPGHRQKTPLDLLTYCQKVVAEAMILVLFGESFVGDVNRVHIIRTAEDVAELTGIFQNQSYFARCFPFIWRVATWIKIIVVHIVIKLGYAMGPAVWAEISRLSDTSREIDKDEITLLSLLVRRRQEADGRISLTSRMWIIGILISAVFASVHQTVAVMVWVMFEIALWPDSQAVICEEIRYLKYKCLSPGGTSKLSLQALNSAVYSDSFIREVMRMKGDTLSSVRMTTKETQLGGYTIPAGHMVFPMTSLSHRSCDYHGPDAKTFNGLQWAGGKMAVTTSVGYIGFGLGRWACPGRFLAVAEIKLLLFTILADMEAELLSGRYEVVDKLNVTSVSPKGLLTLAPISNKAAGI